MRPSPRRVRNCDNLLSLWSRWRIVVLFRCGEAVTQWVMRSTSRKRPQTRFWPPIQVIADSMLPKQMDSVRSINVVVIFRRLRRSVYVKPGSLTFSGSFAPPLSESIVVVLRPSSVSSLTDIAKLSFGRLDFYFCAFSERFRF